MLCLQQLLETQRVNPARVFDVLVIAYVLLVAGVLFRRI
jgi:hypothetical protein